MAKQLIQDGERLISARFTSSGTVIPIYDDGFGSLYINRHSFGVSGIVRAQTWEDAYGICEDEFFLEADETVEQLVKEYGFKRERVKVIHPAIIRPGLPPDVNYSVERDATMADYELTGGALVAGQFVRWETRETPDSEAWTENELFCEAFGFRPNGPNSRDTLNHGIYSKDLNGDSLDILTPELAEALGIAIEISADAEVSTNGH